LIKENFIFFFLLLGCELPNPFEAQFDFRDKVWDTTLNPIINKVQLAAQLNFTIFGLALLRFTILVLRETFLRNIFTSFAYWSTPASPLLSLVSLV
jgi:hypothetical protein